MEDIKKQSLFALEEQLKRQKGILGNSSLLRKLPDKGAKLRDSVAKIEAELERRRNEPPVNLVQVPDVAQLEWALRTTSLSSASSSSVFERSQNEVTNDDAMDGSSHQDDDMMVDDNVETTLKLIATSQLSQREPKPELPEINVKPDPYLAKLVEQDVRTRKDSQENVKFFPAKTLKKTPPGSRSPSEKSAKAVASNSKWDEALVPPKLNSEGVKMLSMEDTIKISCDKFNQAEVIKAAAAPTKKIYAYDRLRDQGLLGGYTVAMQTSRPVRPDMEEDEEADLSHDSLTEDEESEGSEDNDDDNLKPTLKSTKKSGNDLSSILNKSLNLS